MRAAFENEIVRVAGLANLSKRDLMIEGSDINTALVMAEQELKSPDVELTRQSVNKIVLDFKESLQRALDSLGAYSNVEKHMNELIHRANFRFADLHNWLQDSKHELSKCNDLRTLIQGELNRLMSSNHETDSVASISEEEKIELS